MRSNEADPNINAKDASENAKIIGELLNIRPRDVEHILWLNCLASLHKVSNKVLDAESKIEELRLELPYMGVLILTIKDKRITDTAFELEDYTIKEIEKTLSTGESRLISTVRKHVGERLKQKYRELL